MKMLIAAVVAFALALLLVWRNPLVTRNVYRFAFFLGITTFAALLVHPESSWLIKLWRGPVAVAGIAAFLFAAATPFVLLVESGIAGYRGFSSWMRYLCLALSVLGGIGLSMSFLLPRLIRR